MFEIYESASSPRLARNLIKYKRLNRSLDLSPELLALAEQDTVSFPHLTPIENSVLQNLVDHHFRGLIVENLSPTVSKGISLLVEWLKLNPMPVRILFRNKLIKTHFPLEPILDLFNKANLPVEAMNASRYVFDNSHFIIFLEDGFKNALTQSTMGFEFSPNPYVTIVKADFTSPTLETAVLELVENILDSDHVAKLLRKNITNQEFGDVKHQLRCLYPLVSVNLLHDGIDI